MCHPKEYGIIVCSYTWICKYGNTCRSLHVCMCLSSLFHFFSHVFWLFFFSFVHFFSFFFGAFLWIFLSLFIFFHHFSFHFYSFLIFSPFFISFHFYVQFMFSFSDLFAFVPLSFCLLINSKSLFHAWKKVQNQTSVGRFFPYSVFRFLFSCFFILLIVDVLHKNRRRCWKRASTKRGPTRSSRGGMVACRWWIAGEVGGRWSEETKYFHWSLVSAKSGSEARWGPLGTTGGVASWSAAGNAGESRALETKHPLHTRWWQPLFPGGVLVAFSFDWVTMFWCLRSRVENGRRYRRRRVLVRQRPDHMHHAICASSCGQCELGRSACFHCFPDFRVWVLANMPAGRKANEMPLDLVARDSMLLVSCELAPPSRSGWLLLGVVGHWSRLRQGQRNTAAIVRERSATQCCLSPANLLLHLAPDECCLVWLGIGLVCDRDSETLPQPSAKDVRTRINFHSIQILFIIVIHVIYFLDMWLPQHFFCTFRKDRHSTIEFSVQKSLISCLDLRKLTLV